jgi:hypothetical protein
MPATGDRFSVSDSRNNCDIKSIVVKFTQVGQLLHGESVDDVLVTKKAHVTYTYANPSIGWLSHSNAASAGSGGVVSSGNGLEYVHTQDVAASTWIVDHNLDAYPSITVVDSFGDKVHADVQYLSNTRIVVFHSSPFEGKAYLS